jgi:hypothetical protein
VWWREGKEEKGSVPNTLVDHPLRESRLALLVRNSTDVAQDFESTGLDTTAEVTVSSELEREEEGRKEGGLEERGKSTNSALPASVVVARLSMWRTLKP